MNHENGWDNESRDSFQLVPRQTVGNKLARRRSVPFFCKSFAALLFVSITLFYIISNSRTPLTNEHEWENLLHISAKPRCKIPIIPLFSETYNNSADREDVPTINHCGNGSKFTKFLNESTLVLMNPDLYYRNSCSVFEIQRAPILLNDTFSVRDCGTFNHNNRVNHIDSEHVIVSCLSATGESHFDYQSQVILSRGTLASKINYWKKTPKNKLPVSVMILVLDSTSATDAFRHLSGTMKYLIEELNFVQFSRFHALGEPTFLNAMPLLTGIPTHEFFKTKKWTERWDETEFIWDYFNRSYFATAYMEDLPHLGTFNYGGQLGFGKQPTDFYPRSLFSAWESLDGNMDKCLGKSSFWKYLYDYEFEILRSLNGVAPSFTMPWICWPFHDSFGTLYNIEQETLEFFKKIHNATNILENTVLVVMGDHGFYGGEYANSHEGLLERRLPLFLVRIPQRLKELIPNVEFTVRHNSKEIITHYDVYKTLRHLAQLPLDEQKDASDSVNSESVAGLGTSLFHWIPKGRLCKDAGIPMQWCVCNLPEPTGHARGFFGSTTVPKSVLLKPTPPYVSRQP